MVLGFAVGLYYVVATRFFSVTFYETWAFLSTAGPLAVETFDELKEAWMAAEPGIVRDTAWAALDSHAQTMANWWGVPNLATAVFTLPLGFVAGIVVSLATQASRRDAP